MDTESGPDHDLDPENAGSFATTVLRGIQQQNVSFMAGSIAYQAFVSLIPLLVLVFFLVSAVGDEALAERVTAITADVLPDAGQELLADTVEGSVATAGASIIGLVTLLWGSLKIFRSLDTAFSEIYGTVGDNSLLVQLRDALVVFGSLAVALVAAAAATIAFALLPDLPLLGLLNPLVLVVGFSIAFYPMYYLFPDVGLSRREVVPGVVVAAVGWAALQGLFQVYVGLAGGGPGDALGAILLLLTWLYFGGFVFLIGAVVNAAYGGRLAPSGAVVGDDAGDDAPEADATREAGTDDGSAGDADDGLASSVDHGSTGGADHGSIGDGRATRRIDRLRDEVTALERERDQLRADLAAQRTRRYALEDEADALEARLDSLERENERLRRQLVHRLEPTWKRALRRLLAPFDVVSVGRIRDRRG